MGAEHTEAWVECQLCHILSFWGKRLKCPEPHHSPLQNEAMIPRWVGWELNYYVKCPAKEEPHKWPLLKSIITEDITKWNHTSPQKVCPQTGFLYSSQIDLVQKPSGPAWPQECLPSSEFVFPVKGLVRVWAQMGGWLPRGWLQRFVPVLRFRLQYASGHTSPRVPSLR